MNKRKLRERLQKLYEFNAAVPFPASGTQSTTISGMAGFAEDMRYFRPRYANIMMAMLEELAGISPDEMTWGNPDDLIAELAAWIEQRQSEGWDTGYTMALRQKRENNG